MQRVRRKQRARIMQEVEDRELTFSPQINKKSLQILNERRAAGNRRPSLAERHRSRLSQERAVRDGLLPQDFLSVSSAVSATLSNNGGRTTVPGHEEESFSPVINKRSKKLKRNQGEPSVFRRLYQKGLELTKHRAKRAVRPPSHPSRLTLTRTLTMARCLLTGACRGRGRSRSGA